MGESSALPLRPLLFGGALAMSDKQARKLAIAACRAMGRALPHAYSSHFTDAGHFIVTDASGRLAGKLYTPGEFMD